MFDDPQLDVDEAPSGQVYDIGDMVTDVDGRLLVVEDAHCVSSFDCEDPNNWDYVCVDKDLNEFFVGYRGISHKANHMKEVDNIETEQDDLEFLDSLCEDGLMP